MKLELKETGERVLHLTDKEPYKCKGCDQEREQLYYCEVNKRLYCMPCIHRKRACSSTIPHLDYKIDRVVVDNNGKK